MGIFVIIMLVYFLAGILMALWDFRKILFKNPGNQTASSLFIEPPKFLDNLSISTALTFILIWPVKLLLK